MCNNLTYYKDPAERLANILAFHLGISPPPAHQVRKLLREKWDNVSKLAHQIHDEETKASKLKIAIAELSMLDADTIERLVNRTESSQGLIDNFKMVLVAAQRNGNTPTKSTT